MIVIGGLTDTNRSPYFPLFDFVFETFELLNF